MGKCNEDEANFDINYSKLTRQIRLINLIAIFACLCEITFESFYILGDSSTDKSIDIYRIINGIEILIIGVFHAIAGIMISKSLKT